MGKCFGKAEGNMTQMKEKHEEMGGHIKKAMAAHGEAEDINDDMQDTHEEIGKCMGYLSSSEKAATAILQKSATDETALLKADNEKQKDTITKLTEGLGAALKRIETIEKQPQAAKGVLYAVPKGHEREAGDAPETIKSEPDRPMISRL
jgi:predicted  nucleic acid-binding Zn-ribbon protein